MKKYVLNAFGTIAEDKIKELWKLKLLVYALRDTNWIKKTAFLPLLILLLDIGLSQFSRSIILISLFLSFAYIALSMVLFTKIRSIQTKIRHKQNPFPSIAFLHSIFDLASLVMIVASCLLLGVIMLRSLFATELPLQILAALLLLTILVSFLVSPKVLNSKSLSRLNDNRSNRFINSILSFLAVVPSFFLFLAALLLQSGRIEVVKVLIGFLAYLGSSMLIPYIVVGSFEQLLLLKHWPHVKRIGSDFSIVLGEGV